MLRERHGHAASKDVVIRNSEKVNVNESTQKQRYLNYRNYGHMNHMDFTSENWTMPKKTGVVTDWLPAKNNDMGWYTFLLSETY